MNANQQPVIEESTVDEYIIRLPKKKKHLSMMRFNGNLRVNVTKWEKAKLNRENNSSAYKNGVEDLPKFGAGSAFGHEARLEARRKKFGGKNKYDADNQPWILKTIEKEETSQESSQKPADKPSEKTSQKPAEKPSEKTSQKPAEKPSQKTSQKPAEKASQKTSQKPAEKPSQKTFRGLRDGGINENSVYYVFVTGLDRSGSGTPLIEAHRLDEWYSFQPIQRYRTLNDEEAEENFNKRLATYNFFNVMARKKLRMNDETEEPEEAKPKKGPKIKPEFMVSEMDDWADSSDSADEEDAENKTKQNKKSVVKKKKKKQDSDNEAFEDSDDGDDEGREKEYDTESSESESELVKMAELKSVEEDGLRKQLVSDDESEDEEEKKEEENEEKKEDSSSDSGSEQVKKDGKKQVVTKVEEKTETPSGPSSADSESSCDKTVPTVKRKAQEVVENLKRRRVESPVPTVKAGKSNDILTESAVRKYLERKPITITELLQKFKKKTGLSNDQLAARVMDILIKLKPKDRFINEKRYYSL